MAQQPAVQPERRKTTRLLWQLLRVYVLTTVAVTVGLELLVLVLLFLPTAQYLAEPELIVRDTVAGTAEVAPLLEADPPRLDELTQALRDATGEIVIDSSQRQYGLLVFVQVSPWAYIAVADPQGVVLTCSPTGTWQVGQPLVSQVTADEAKVLRRAAAGETAWCAADLPPQGRRTTVATPVLAADQRRLGTLFVRHDVPFDWWTSIRMLVAYLTPTLAAGVVVAGLVGLLLGWLSARGLVRRIAGISRAAASWSRGDLEVAIAPSGNDELGQMARQLNDMAQQLRAVLVDQRAYAAAAERAKLARDLHDTVKQQIFATALELATAQAKQGNAPAEASEHLTRAAEMVKQVQRDLAAIVTTLRTGEEQTAQDLPFLLRATAGPWSQQAGIAFELTCEPLPPVSWALGVTFVRLLQGALANIARHSGASQAGAELRLAGGWLTLRIHDNGRGFHVTPELTSRGGLAMLRERAESLPGGTLSIESQPGAGTHVVIRCRLEEAEE